MSQSIYPDVSRVIDEVQLAVKDTDKEIEELKNNDRILSDHLLSCRKDLGDLAEIYNRQMDSMIDNTTSLLMLYRALNKDVHNLQRVFFSLGIVTLLLIVNAIIVFLKIKGVI